MIGGVLHCHICGSKRLRDKPFGYQFNNKWLQSLECLDCGIIFLYPQPSAAEIVRMYSRGYFEGDFRCGHAGSYFDCATLDQLADIPLLERITRHKPNGKLLEIGCAGGAFLSAAQEMGYEVQGVEFSDDAAQFARRKFGLNVITGDIGSVNFSNGTFDVVFLGDVLEHLRNPVTSLREINRILAHEGLIVLQCPTQTNTLFSRFGFAVYLAVGKNATVHLPPYHLFEYRPKSLTLLLQRSGFSIVSMEECILSPKDIALRGSLLQRIGKKLFQYPNYFLTRIFGILGDRIEIFATKSTIASP